LLVTISLRPSSARTPPIWVAVSFPPFGEQLAQGEDVAEAVPLDVDAAIGFVGVERRHGAGGAVDADVGGHRHVDAVDDDPYVRVIVLGRPHRSQVQSGGRDPGRRVIWCRPGGAEVSLRTGEVAETLGGWSGRAGGGIRRS
jgi:hypothetical protein